MAASQVKMNICRVCGMGSGIPQGSHATDMGRNVCESDGIHTNARTNLSSADINLLGEFVLFLKSKKAKFGDHSRQFPKIDCNDNVKARAAPSTFRENVTSYFGDYLPMEVINELCKLVHDDSYGKCSFSIMPIESLVLSVLKILLGAAQKNADRKVNIVSSGSRAFSRNNINEAFAGPTEIGIPREEECLKQAKRCSAEGFIHLKRRRINIADDVGGAKEIIDIDGAQKTSATLNQSRFEANVIGECSRTNPNTNQCVAPQKIGIPEVQFISSSKFKDRCSHLGRVADQLYNKRNIPTSGNISTNLFGGATALKPIARGYTENMEGETVQVDANNFQKQADDGNRFSVSDIERGHYNIICGLVYSQWKCFPAIQFFKTNVTYWSLGESVKPSGHVDNFFIAGMCRKFFEEEHPRISKKHYFYPHVGGSLYTYNCSFDETVVKNSFLGANSAHKLHLSAKLCFPLCVNKHWFVFIVDLVNKMFVFLDSYFDENDSFQIRARDNLLKSFSECWYEHADVKLNVNDFSIVYPSIPKQDNPDDCGIFCVKFMELWDNSIDLRQMFSHQDIPNIRIRLAIDLYFSNMNSIDKSLVKNLHEQGIDLRSCN